MKVKATDLSGIALDWAVAMAEGGHSLRYDTVACWWFTLEGKDRVLSRAWAPSMNWAPSALPEQGMPIMEEMLGFELKVWLQVGLRPNMRVEAHVHNYEGDWIVFGPTILIAAMRCYVAYKLGDEIEIPDHFKEQA